MNPPLLSTLNFSGSEFCCIRRCFQEIKNHTSHRPPDKSLLEEQAQSGKTIKDTLKRNGNKWERKGQGVKQREAAG
jgi:hypothetical protein